MRFFRIVTVLLLLIVVPLSADLNRHPGVSTFFSEPECVSCPLDFRLFRIGGLESISFNPAAAGG